VGPVDVTCRPGALGTSSYPSAEFLTIAVVFFALRVFNDDYARIRLNECARLRAAKAYKAAFPEPPGGRPAER